MTYFKYESNKGLKENIEVSDFDIMAPEKIKNIKKFHQGFSEYQKTPLWALKDLSSKLGLKNIYVKDESYRFNLNAFKVLGGTYAIGKYIAKALNQPLKSLTVDDLKAENTVDQLGKLRFVTATDGNHGRGIAWAAKVLGYAAVVFMPKGSAIERLNNIKNEGAEAYITDMNYDDAVRHAETYAKEHHGILVQDSSWPGYMEIPKWIMQGYGTVMAEVYEEINRLALLQPTHVFLQAGVGSFAGSMLGYMIGLLGNQYPKTYIVEPNNADCIYQSALQNNGEPKSVTGDLNTIMAGLACGEPSLVAYKTLRDFSSGYFSCKDELSALGMRILGAPLLKDPQIISGESGAIGVGLIYDLMMNPSSKETCEALKLNKDSVVLFISTEGDTDPINYQEVMWEGRYSYRIK